VRSGLLKRLLAVVIGVAVAAAAMAAFMLWLATYIDQRGNEEVDVLARRTITIADARIVSALASLDGLTMQGVDTCGPAQIDKLRRAAFVNPWVKDVVVVSAEGQILCGSSGTSIGSPHIVTSYRPNGEGDLSISVIRLGEGDTMIAAVRRAKGAPGLAALIPAAMFIAQVSREGTNTSSHIRMVAADGTAIVERGTPADSGDAADWFVASRQSARYGLKTTVSLPRAALEVETRRLNAIATTIASAILALIIGLAVLLPRRRGGAGPVAELEQAITDNEFVPYYQPVVDIRTGRLRGAEVLIRWRKPDGTIVMPSTFIPIAESSGLIIPLTRALMRRVSEEAGPVVALRPDIKIGFNLAAAHFVDDTIVNDVGEIFANSAMPLRQVIFEVTERQPLHSLAGARRVIAGLQGLGCSVAIDDVGTGHGGLSYILKLGADTIKIDKLFVDGIGTEHESTIILEMLVDLARNMRMDVVAEGVETFEQVIKLRELGILAAQGHVFCPPLPGSSFLKLVEAIAPTARGILDREDTDALTMLSGAAAAA
jgi:sensor c-di-GMP phosphodiesterase-like protein